MSVVHEIDHPLVRHKLAVLRNKNTSVKEFRELVGEISALMFYEASRNLPTEEILVETPLAVAKCRQLAGKKLAIIPILRAGLGMVDTIVALIPSAKIGHIGLYRDPETHKPVEYYCKLPDDIGNREVFVVDPMLATGGSMELAYEALSSKGTPKHIHIASVIASKQAIDFIQQKLPKNTTVWVAAIDPVLNSQAYIVPGLGDAGDLAFGEKL